MSAPTLDPADFAPLTAYYNPLAGGVLGNNPLISRGMTGPMPRGSSAVGQPSFSAGPLSQLAYQMAGSPKAGPLQDVYGTPQNLPGFNYGTTAGASGPGTGSGAGSAALGILAGLAKNPAAYKAASSALGGLFGGGAGALGADMSPAAISALTAAEPALTDLSPALADISANATLPVDVSGALGSDAAGATTAADTGAASGGSALGALGGALGGAALGAGLLYGTASLFDMLDPNVQMTSQQIAAVQPKQSQAEIAARQTEPLMTSNMFNPYSSLDPAQLAAFGLLTPYG